MPSFPARSIGGLPANIPAVIDSGRSGFPYIFSNNTTASAPGDGHIRFNNAALFSTTNVYIGDYDSTLTALIVEISSWDDSTSSIKGKLIIRKRSNPAVNVIFSVVGPITDNTTWSTIPVLYVASNLTFTDLDDVTVQFIPTGDAGVSARNVVDIFQGTTTYTPTAGTIRLYVECIGGGGAGGGSATSSSQVSLGSGGGAGAYSAVWIASPAGSYTVQVGAGGTGNSGATGNAGTDTTFGASSVCTAKAGAGGITLAAGTSTFTQPGGLGGASGSGVGDLKTDGSDGGWGFRISGIAGQSGNGGNAPLSAGMAAGKNSVGAGNTGKNYGGGGGGGITISTANAGGAGANGLIRVWEF
jgi:hypothetical protein